MVSRLWGWVGPKPTIRPRTRAQAVNRTTTKAKKHRPSWVYLRVRTDCFFQVYECASFLVAERMTLSPPVSARPNVCRALSAKADG